MFFVPNASYNYQPFFPYAKCNYFSFKEKIYLWDVKLYLMGYSDKVFTQSASVLALSFTFRCLSVCLSFCHFADLAVISEIFPKEPATNI
jgi:hypothetical protein